MAELFPEGNVVVLERGRKRRNYSIRFLHIFLASSRSMHRFTYVLWRKNITQKLAVDKIINIYLLYVPVFRKNAFRIFIVGQQSVSLWARILHINYNYKKYIQLKILHTFCFIIVMFLRLQIISLRWLLKKRSLSYTPWILIQIVLP